MKYHAVLTVRGDKNILKLFKAEQFRHKRSKYSVRMKGNDVVFDASAEDATAMRATLESIMKVLKVYEDSRKV